MTTLPIPVDDKTAAAYQAASPHERERIARYVTEYLKATLVVASRSERIGEIADRMSTSAQANGWTEEMNEALLRGDVDNDA